jgi:hypothetical protein
MKKSIRTLALVVGALSSSSVLAGSYWGLGFSNYELESEFDGLELTTDIRGIEGAYGFESSPNIAWEFRLGLGLGDNDVKLSTGNNSFSSGINYKASSYFSGYFRPQYVTESFQFYGLLGYSSVSGELSGGGVSEDTSDDGISYGVGAGFIFSDNNAFNLEWKNLAAIDDGDITGLSLTYQRRF